MKAGLAIASFVVGVIATIGTWVAIFEGNTPNISGNSSLGDVGRDAHVSFNLNSQSARSTLETDVQRDLLDEMKALIVDPAERGALDVDEAGSQALAQGLTEIARHAPLNHYVLAGSQFSVERHTAYLVEQTGTLLSYNRFSGGFFTFHVDGERQTLTVGQILNLAGNRLECRLLLNGGEDYVNRADMTLLCP